jgi:hypothetical protein
MRSFIVCALHQVLLGSLNQGGAGHVARMGEMINTHKMLVRMPEGKLSPRHRWEDNIKMYVKEIAWTGLFWLRIGCFEHGREPSSSIDVGKPLD